MLPDRLVSRHPLGTLISDLSRTRITKGLHERLLQRLVKAGALCQCRTDVLGLRRWPRADPQPKEEIRRRLQSCLIGNEEPTERTVALASLLCATAGLDKVLPRADAGTRKAIIARAKAINDGDWAGAAVKAAIDEAHATGIG